MPDEPPLIGYAPPGLDQPADRLLRRIVGGLAIVWGGQALLTTALTVGLSRGWLATPPSMSWAIDEQWQMVFMAAGALVSLATLLGGVLLLRRSPAGILILRVTAASSGVLVVVGMAMHLSTNTILAGYWSTPGSAAFNALQLFDNLWLPALMVFLTLPPLARRMA